MVGVLGEKLVVHNIEKALSGKKPINKTYMKFADILSI